MLRLAPALLALAAPASGECNPASNCTDPAVQACWLHHAAIHCPGGGSQCGLCDPGKGGGPLCNNVRWSPSRPSALEGRVYSC